MKRMQHHIAWIGLDGSGASRLAVDGSVTLAGTLAVTLHDGYTPPPGIPFTLLTAEDGVSGTFDTVHDGAKVSIEGNTVVLEFPPKGTVILLR